MHYMHAITEYVVQFTHKCYQNLSEVASVLHNLLTVECGLKMFLAIAFHLSKTWHVKQPHIVLLYIGMRAGDNGYCIVAHCGIVLALLVEYEIRKGHQFKPSLGHW